MSPICCLAAVDGFGNILSACHGLRFLRPDEINERYPNKFIQLSEKRIYVYNTLFNLPEIYLLAGIIEYFIRSPDYKEIKEGFKWKDVVMSYNSIFQAMFRIRFLLSGSGSDFFFPCPDPNRQKIRIRIMKKSL